MLYAYTNSDTTVAVNGLLPINTVGIQTGCTVTATPGSTTINLNRPGFYKVDFSAAGATSSTTAGAITVAMRTNGVLYPGATSSDNSASATDFGSVSFSAIVQVEKQCGCSCHSTAPTSLTFINTGIAATFTNIEVTVTKLA